MYQYKKLLGTSVHMTRDVSSTRECRLNVQHVHILYM